MQTRQNNLPIEGLPRKTSFQNKGFNISQDDSYFENISNALVSFLSLSKKIHRNDITNPETNSEFRNILKQEFESKEGIPDVNNVPLTTKKYKSPRDFIKETAPKHWNVAHLQKALSNWIEKLKSKHGLILDFDIGVIYDHEKNESVLNINGSLYNLVNNIEKWEKIINNYCEDAYWQEVKEDEYIEIEGEDSVKSIEAILLNALSKNVSSRFYEFLWLTYKTCEKFILLKEIDGKLFRVFIKEGDLLTSMKF